MVSNCVFCFLFKVLRVVGASFYLVTYNYNAENSAFNFFFVSSLSFSHFPLHTFTCIWKALDFKMMINGRGTNGRRHTTMCTLVDCLRRVCSTLNTWQIEGDYRWLILTNQMSFLLLQDSLLSLSIRGFVNISNFIVKLDISSLNWFFLIYSNQITD